MMVVVAMPQSAKAELSHELFLNPPDNAKPRTWMHVMNQNLSEQGLEKDLQSLADVGIGGALIFSIGISPKGKVEFDSPEFHAILQQGIKKADHLGLAIGVHNCDGWTSSGGPWVTPPESMKQVVFSETVVDGGSVSMPLKQPRVMLDFYRDIGVIAVPATAEEKAEMENRSHLSSSNKEDIGLLRDGKIDTTVILDSTKPERDRWIQFSYDEPMTARFIYGETLTRNASAELFVSNDGKSFEKATELRVIRTGKRVWAIEQNLQNIKARHFRVQFKTDTEVMHLELSSTPRMPQWTGQISIKSTGDSGLHRDLLRDKETPVTKMNQVIDLSSSMSKDGFLKAKLPDGVWRIYRFGYTSTGAMNSPATEKGKGLECDKLKASALDKHFANYVGKIANQAGELTGKSFRFSEIDSYEVGGQNWTEDYADMFLKAYGYNLMPFMPLFAGRMIEDRQTSSAVLRDLRSFTCDLMAENYYKRFTELCNQHGMVSYIENYGNGPINGLDAGKYADIPMGEFWVDERPATHFPSPISAAHIYGKPIISAEAFTESMHPNWGVHPYMLKRKGDFAWTKGINEFMFHRYAHQPNTKVVPGMSMHEWGSHVDGTQTWWLNAGKAWMKYLQRGSWMLRQGVPANDLLIYVGEGSPHALYRRSILRNLPNTNNYDYCNADVLINRVKVVDGKLVLPEGTIYQAVYFKDSDQMSLAMLKRIGELADHGATVVVKKPNAPIGYIERRDQSGEFKKLAERIWKKHGKNLKQPSNWQKAFEVADIEPDYVVKGDPSASFVHRVAGDTDFYFIHSTKEEASTIEASFRITGRVPELWHPDTGKMETVAQFTQKNGRTELPIQLDPLGSVFVVFRKPVGDFHAITSLKPAGAMAIVNPETGIIQLSSEAAGPVEIKFSSGKKTTVNFPALAKPLSVKGSWMVEFDGVGVQQPNVLQFDQLSDLKDHPRDDIKHFSGTASYRKSFEVSKDWIAKGDQTFLNLEQVDVAAEVILNGQNLGVLWKPPFKLDVTGQLKDGANELIVKVTNTWTNRLVGDAQFERTDGYGRGIRTMPDWFTNNEPLPPGKRSTFSSYPFFEKKGTHILVPSGLQGPVRLEQTGVIRLED